MISSRISQADATRLRIQRDANTGPGVVGDGILQLGNLMAREFSAPVGIFDLNHRAWKLLIGAEKEQFPIGDSRLQEVAGSSGLRLGRVAVWRRDEDLERTWLVLPLFSAEAADLVAFVGFLAPTQPRET